MRRKGRSSVESNVGKKDLEAGWVGSPNPLERKKKKKSIYLALESQIPTSERKINPALESDSILKHQINNSH